jgi:hypothetical protein
VKRRDLAILGAVLLVGGLAALDAFRGGEDELGGGGGPPPRTEPGLQGRTASGPVSLPGRLVYTDGQCRVRELNLASASIPRLVAQGACGLWGPARSGRIAYGIRALLESDSVRFRVIDLDARSPGYGTYQALWDSIVWSPDGSALAWCEVPRLGRQLVLGSEPQRLSQCPAAYTQSGELAFVSGRRLLLGEARRLVRPPASARIAAVSFGNDGSLALAVGDEILRYSSIGATNPVSRVPIRDPYVGAPLFAPDNCAVLLRSPHTRQPPTMTVLGLECGRPVNLRVLPVTSNGAAWSPDSQWFAIVDDQGIGFRTPAGAIAQDRILGFANQLLWKEARP